jgi:hypothetical protein
VSEMKDEYDFSNGVRGKYAGKIAVLIRRKALQDAAKAICGYCRGLEGHNPVPAFDEHDGYWHVFTHGNGWNRCSAGGIWALIKKEAENNDHVQKV